MEGNSFCIVSIWELSRCLIVEGETLCGRETLGGDPTLILCSFLSINNIFFLFSILIWVPNRPTCQNQIPGRRNRWIQNWGKGNCQISYREQNGWFRAITWNGPLIMDIIQGCLAFPTSKIKKMFHHNQWIICDEGCKCHPLECWQNYTA